MDKALSNKDIMNLINNKANLLTYQELQNYDNLDDALGPYGALVLLYTTRKNFGHWVAVFKVNENTIEHFDSYGLAPDEELKFIPEYFRKVNYDKIPHLTYLLYNSGYNVIYNEYQLQKHMQDYNTCGRWVATRIKYRMIPQQQFAKFFLEYKNPDKIVTEITSNV
jgi:hypothetical protein